jgi:RNA polymerase sigma-70 factor (ECF subfamily)
MTDVEALYTANHDRLFRYFCRAVGHIEDARELTQDVFIRVNRSVIPTGPEGAIRGWLFQIARNLALDHRRSRHRRPHAEALTDHAFRHASQETSAQVNQALAALSDLDRDVFLMRVVAGLGYDDIAHACGLTPDAVRNRIHRARLQLRLQLSGQIAARRAAPMRRTGRDS